MDDRNSPDHAACEIKKEIELWFSLLALCPCMKENECSLSKPVQVFLR